MQWQQCRCSSLWWRCFHWLTAVWTQKTRFRPLGVVLPVLPCLMGTGAIGYLRAQAALANMPDYGVSLATVNERSAFEQSLLHAGQDALNGAAIVIAVLVVVLLVLWRVDARPGCHSLVRLCWRCML